jgi:hypothetical protein
MKLEFRLDHKHRIDRLLMLLPHKHVDIERIGYCKQKKTNGANVLMTLDSKKLI